MSNSTVRTLNAAAPSSVTSDGPVPEVVEKLEQMLKLARDGQITAFAAAVVGPFAREPMLYAKTRAETLQLIGSIEVAKGLLVVVELEDCDALWDGD